MKVSDLLALEELRKSLSKEKFELLCNDLGTTVDEFNLKIAGKYKELDFILSLYLLQCCSQVILIDETYSEIFDLYTSDAIVEFVTGEKCLIEIKSTHKDIFRISVGNLEKRIKFAENNNYTLYFAISFYNDLWCLFSSDYMKSKKGKISIDDIKNSIIEEKLGVRYYFFKNFHYTSIYSKNFKNSIGGYEFDGYGGLVSEELRLNNKRVYKIKNKEKDKKYLWILMMSEGIKSRASSNQQIKSVSSDLTRIDEHLDGHLIGEIELLLEPIRHIEGFKKNTSKEYLDYLKEHKNCFYNIDTLRKMLSEFGLSVMRVGINESFAKLNREFFKKYKV